MSGWFEGQNGDRQYGIRWDKPGQNGDTGGVD